MIRKKIILILLGLVVVMSTYAQNGDYYSLKAKADSGDVRAMIELAKLCDHWNQGKHKEALEWYLKAEKAGNKEVQYEIGRHYHEGSGTSVDYEKALAYYQKALEYGLKGDAATGIGNIYYRKEKNFEKAVEYYKIGVERDETDAPYRLAEMYLFGEGTPQNYQEAYRLYYKCCAYKSDAASRIGQMYFHGLGMSVNYPKAMEWFKYSLQHYGGFRGTSMRLIGHMYEEGLGVEKNYQEAINWYQQAIKKEEDAASMCLLGDMYLVGEGVDRDEEKAKSLYKKAIEHGEVSGMRKIGLIYECKCDFAKAMEWYKKAASSGDARSNWNIAIFYYGGHGVDEDKEKAFTWFLQAAIAGDLRGMISIGLCYYSGDGVEQNYTSAMNWWMKAIEKFDDEEAMNNVGVLYQEGLGVSQNYKEAYEWFTKASEKGNVYATGNLGEMYYHGHYVKKDYNKAFTLLKESAEKGGPSSCMRLLSACYRYGLGTVRDAKQEKFWMEKASESGDDIAIKILSRANEPEYIKQQQTIE